MSGQLSVEDILYRQRMLSCSGLYSRKLDGVWGRHTDEAERTFFNSCDDLAEKHGHFDPRSERNIRSLRLDAQLLCRQSLAAIRAQGVDARVISGTRTYAQQAALFRQGRNGNKLPRVTNANAGQSWHNFGLAWDIGIFKGGEYITTHKPYTDAANHGKIAGVEWGGDWESFPDIPHYQTPFGASSIKQARAQFELGGRKA